MEAWGSPTFHPETYRDEVQSGPCVFCKIALGRETNDGEYRIHETPEFMVVLDRYPTQVGYVQVFPIAHVVSLEELGRDRYLRLQELVYRVAMALTEVIACERVYTALLGSYLMTPHLHVHVVPLPAGLPLHLQEWAALDKAHGVVALDPTQSRRIVEQLQSHLLR